MKEVVLVVETEPDRYGLGDITLDMVGVWADYDETTLELAGVGRSVNRLGLPGNAEERHNQLRIYLVMRLLHESFYS